MPCDLIREIEFVFRVGWREARAGICRCYSVVGQFNLGHCQDYHIILKTDGLSEGFVCGSTNGAHTQARANALAQASLLASVIEVSP
jgi:hypothetical protein